MTDAEIQKLAETIINDKKFQTKIIRAMAHIVLNDNNVVAQLKSGLKDELSKMTKAAREEAKDRIREWTHKHFPNEVKGAIAHLDGFLHRELNEIAADEGRKHVISLLRERFSDIELKFSLKDLLNAEDKKKNPRREYDDPYDY